MLYRTAPVQEVGGKTRQTHLMKVPVIFAIDFGYIR